VEDIISGLEDKVAITEETDEYIKKRIKKYERNMQEHCDSIERPNLRIKDIKEREDVQVKSIGNIFNKIIAEKIPNLEKEMPIQVQEASRTTNICDQHRTFSPLNMENNVRILKLQGRNVKSLIKINPSE
jgi:hypothetical protein